MVYGCMCQGQEMMTLHTTRPNDLVFVSRTLSVMDKKKRATGRYVVTCVVMSSLHGIDPVEYELVHGFLTLSARTIKPPHIQTSSPSLRQKFTQIWLYGHFSIGGVELTHILLN